MQVWIAWFGPARLIVSALSVAVVAVGVGWLVRAPAPTTEAGLPFAGAASTVSAATASATLPPPVPRPSTTVAIGSVVVHVAGAVLRPGVHRLGADARVDDAIAAAGGATSVADLDGLNLAAGIADGQRIYVPEAGEVDPASVPSGPTPGDQPSDDTSGVGEPVDLNTATAAQLEALPGVGPATATAIIEDRDRNGPFATVADLERVPGIGPAKLAAIADRVTV